MSNPQPESPWGRAASQLLKRRRFRQAALVALAGLALLRSSLCAGLPAGRSSELYPQGDVFCFTFYSTSEPDSAYALKNGATAIGPFYGDQARALRLAERLDTRLLYQSAPAVDGRMAAR